MKSHLGFSPKTLGEAVSTISNELLKVGIKTNLIDARLLVSNATGISTEEILFYPSQIIDKRSRKQLTSLLERRLKREPIHYLLKEREFWSMNFLVSPATLIPRPETETLVQTVICNAVESYNSKSLSILDLGTGSGCILLSLLSELSLAQGIGVDICFDALSIAQINAERFKLSERACFVQGDWHACLGSKYDIIVANPPYIQSERIPILEPEVNIYEPVIALDGGSDGLSAYREICARLSNYVAPHGFIVFEVGQNQALDVSEILTLAGFKKTIFYKDLAGKDRVVLATRKE